MIKIKKLRILSILFIVAIIGYSFTKLDNIAFLSGLLFGFALPWFLLVCTPPIEISINMMDDKDD